MAFVDELENNVKDEVTKERTFEELLLNAVRENLINEARRLTNEKMLEIQEEMSKMLIREIDKAVNSLYISSHNNVDTLTKDITISFKERLRPDKE